jgi:hypothetical protein
MFFRIGNRIVEVRGSFVAVLAIIALALIIFFGLFANIPPVFKTIYFIIVLMIAVFFIVIYFISRKGNSIRPSAKMEYGFMELLLKMKRNAKNILLVSLVFVLMFSSVYYVASYGFPKISMPTVNIKSIFSEKSPSIESPKNDIQSTIKETSSTTVQKTTTTTTTSTTRKKPSAEGKRSGFYVYQKDVVYTDCSFDGRGHDAVLMPSGNYYCRSTEQRMTITVNGVEKVCCIAP